MNGLAPQEGAVGPLCLPQLQDQKYLDWLHQQRRVVWYGQFQSMSRVIHLKSFLRRQGGYSHVDDPQIIRMVF